MELHLHVGGLQFFLLRLLFFSLLFSLVRVLVLRQWVFSFSQFLYELNLTLGVFSMKSGTIAFPVIRYNPISVNSLCCTVAPAESNNEWNIAKISAPTIPPPSAPLRSATPSYCNKQSPIRVRTEFA